MLEARKRRLNRHPSCRRHVKSQVRTRPRETGDALEAHAEGAAVEGGRKLELVEAAEPFLFLLAATGLAAAFLIAEAAHKRLKRSQSHQRRRSHASCPETKKGKEWRQMTDDMVAEQRHGGLK